MTRLRDNPAIARNATALHRWIIATAGVLRGTIVFAAWPYLVVAIFAAPFALVLIASGALNVLPLVFFAPSAELR